MTKASTLRLTQLALFSALIVVMTFVPYLGYITIGASLSITTLHIPVIIGAILLGRAGGTILGTVWGITCLIYAAMNGTADAVIFLNPLVSVVPRILVGFLAAFFYEIAVKLCKGKTSSVLLTSVMSIIISVFVYFFVYNLSNSLIVSVIVAGIVLLVFAIASFIFYAKYNRLNTIPIPIVFASILGTFSNTVLVLTAISLFGTEGFIQLTGLVGSIFNTVIALNGTVEMIAAVLIAVPCTMALIKVRNKMKI